MTKTVRLSVAGASLAALIWGGFIERNLPVLKNEELPILPKGHRALRVLHLSDLHLAPWQKRKATWVSSLSRLQPDFVVLTGDLLGHSRALPFLRKTLQSFKGVPGVFVHGSNDYYAPVLKNPFKYLQEPSRLGTKVPDLNTAALEEFLEDDLRFVNLNNSATTLNIFDSGVRLFGLNDPHVSFDEPELMLQALSKLDSADSADVRLGVVHAPYTDSLNLFLQTGSDLIFAGHTHGGQVRIPGIGALTSNSDLPASLARGLSVWHSQDYKADNAASFLHVSAGVGTSIFAPVRFACRPEATVLTLTERG